MNEKPPRWAALGAELKGYRLARGLSISEVDRSTGIDKSGISRWERGIARPRPDSLAVLMDRYGLHAAERENLLILARWRTAEGDWLPEKEPPGATDPLALVLQAMQHGPWPEAVCVAVYALLAAPFHERKRLEQELRAAADRALANLGQTNDLVIGPAPTAEQMTQAVLARVLAEVFGPSGGRLSGPP